jgi:hypothetical protein
MTRDALTTTDYWDQWIKFFESSILESIQRISEPSKNPAYRPQYVRDLAFMHAKVMYYRYSRGDSIADLAQYFDPLLRYWEESERLGKDVWTPEQRHKRQTWSVNLDQYIDCFWLVGLALALDIPEPQWRRLISLCGNDGEDRLLDGIIATRSPERKIGHFLCYPKPYQRLLATIDASPSKQALKLGEFVGHWYKELAVAVKSGRHAQALSSRVPYWHTYHQPMKGAYFGYWCIEAVAAVKAFGLDDRLCIGHPHYPGDLLRPGQVTESDMSRLLPELAATIGAPPEPSFTGEPRHLTKWEAIKLLVKNRLNS